MKITHKSLLYSLAVLLLTILGFQVAEYFTYQANQNKIALTKAQITTNTLRGEIEDLLQKIENEGQALGKIFAENEYSTEDVKELIRKSALDFPEIQGITACYEPYALSEEVNLFCPYYNKSTQSYVFIEDSYDYTVKGSRTAWYTDIVEKGAAWINPYYGTAVKAWYLDYGVPFYYQSGPKKGQVRGIIDFSLEMGDFKNIVHSISVGKTGYAFITAENGAFITHPLSDHIGTKTLDEWAENETSPDLIAAYNAIKSGGKGYVEFIDEVTGKPSLFFYDHISISDYGLGLFFTKKDLTGDQTALNRRIIRMALIFSIFLVIMIALYFGRDNLDRGEIEFLSFVTSLLLFANIYLIGLLQHGLQASLNVNNSPPIVDLTSLGSFIDKQDEKASRLNIPKSTPVPTGIFIERMEFEDSYNINLGGTVWQRYPLDIAETVKVGFRFPQMSPFAEAAYIEESYRDVIEPKEGAEGYLLVGWDFRVTLRLNLEYADFPFDKRHLDIEITPLSATDGLIFVPDLSGYSFTNPDRKSGMSKDIELSGNHIVETYFNFTTHTIDASFGYPSHIAFEDITVLHYNVRLNRKLLNAFVTYLIPIFVTLSMMYILILASNKSGDRQGIIESMAAFFFVLIFSHIDLRKNIVTADLIFIEYFYFITYLMIVLSTLNLITYTKDKTQLFDYNENQIFRAVYFPVFLSLVLIVMFYKFY